MNFQGFTFYPLKEVSSSKLYTHLIKGSNGGTWLVFSVLVPNLFLTLHDLSKEVSPVALSFYAIVSPSGLGFKQVVPYMIHPLKGVSGRV